jgi:L-threonylcarbamoyladenylate synthase
MNENLKNAIECLQRGEIILFPTDTIWGIGCDATNEEACKRIEELKNRPDNKSFVILVDGFQMIEKYIPEFPPVIYDLVDLSEKPLTVVYPGAKNLAPSVLASDGSVGIRLTKDPLCVSLIRGLKKPIVATSANISNQPFPTCFEEISEEIKKGINATILEKLNETRNQPSQIIKIGLDSSIKIIRS